MSWTLCCHSHTEAVGDEQLHGEMVSSCRIAGAWRACSCKVDRLGHDQDGRREGTAWAWRSPYPC